MKNFNYIQFLFDYGTLIVLVGLCFLFSYVTIEEQSPASTTSAELLAKVIKKDLTENNNIIVLARQGSEGKKTWTCAQCLQKKLQESSKKHQ